MTYVGIAGFRGYSGAELVQLLSRHPHVRPVLLEHRSDAEQRPAPLNAKSASVLPCTAEAVQKGKLAAVFLATPQEVSMELTSTLLGSSAKVIDLSGAYRLGTAENYRRWYKEEHTSPELLAEAVYGLPEFCRKAVPGARLISNPGCYPTAANLAIRPLIEHGIIDRAHGIVCDAKSGVSGAGRKPSSKTHFCEVTENFSAYSILDHRHVPEVLRISGLNEHEFSFTAQLIPIDRGILETIYFRAAAGTTADQILEAYQTRYESEPFVRVYKPGQVPDLRAVQRTNCCDIGFRFDSATGRAVAVSVIDNLVKGAAGQAVQNMNLALGFDETAGLLLKALVKLGGTLLDAPETRARLAREIASFAQSANVVVVHGGGKQMTRYLAERGIESKFVNGLRVSTPEVIDALLKVLAGTVNQELVAAFAGAGAHPVGLTGLDGGISMAEQLSPELGAVGKPVRSNPELLDLLSSNGYLPVVACLGGGPKGEIYNVNADQMAISCAAAFHADCLFFLTDVDGCRDQYGDIAPILTPSCIDQLIADGVATGGMQAKLESAKAALASGVGEIVIAPGQAPGIVATLAAGERAGTRIVRGQRA